MITQITVLIGSDIIPSDAVLRLLMADICDVLVLNGGGVVTGSDMLANSIVVAKFLDIAPEENQEFLDSVLINAAMAVVPVKPEEEIIDGNRTDDD